MTRIYTSDGTFDAEPPQRKRRAKPRALRFSDIKVGNELSKRMTWHGERAVTFYVVTDLWFDPVAGQRDHEAGNMVAVRRIEPFPTDRKEPHTRRGLASQGFRYRYSDMRNA